MYLYNYVDGLARSFRLVGEKNFRIPIENGCRDWREDTVDERNNYGHSSDQNVHVGKTVCLPSAVYEKVSMWSDYLLWYTVSHELYDNYFIDAFFNKKKNYTYIYMYIGVTLKEGVTFD